MDNMNILDEIIVGRVEPQIYAFTTNTIPNYLKVGDTYRSLSVRLEEWKRFFPNLKEEFHDAALVDEDSFFRDYSVHQYLEGDLGKKRLMQDQLEAGIYYSKEFFKDASAKDVKEAIGDIRENYEKNTGKYQYYSAETHLPEIHVYASSGEWEPRPNQQAAVDSFAKAVKNGRTNLLMYAVMRFGKSFTSLLCAKTIAAKLVLVVSAKADVKDEWRKTVQSADNFNKEYVFISSDDLRGDDEIIKKAIKSGKSVVIFLSLQDLQGDDIKDKHKELFSNHVDLLIIDETHFGARAEKYGQVLRNAKDEKDIKDRHATEDFIDINEAEEQLKILDAKIRLHLSGTPYRILMGSEFSKEDIIAFCQFSDIVQAQEEWDKEHSLSDDYKEWENPYYGFPQMVRFAFNPSTAAKLKLEELRKNGHTYAFSALLKPQSVKKDEKENKHKKFIHEKEVLELLEVIDGSKQDENVLGFLNYDKIKEGKMCRHMVMVLPYCASCDAMEELIKKNCKIFRNLNEYKIINISGVEGAAAFRKIQDIKNEIRNCEGRDQKTLTLTVNRMLTGSTVEEWDTMVYLKDTASPQEYDQAVFRLQNQYVRTMRDGSGDEIKYNMKPQTLLVDFDPHRMFVMQEQKSLIYNANIEKGGNSRLKERITEELRISPIITLNKNKLERVEPVDILQAVSEYSSNRGVMDETRDIPVDISLLDIDEIRKIIEVQSEIGSNKGFETESSQGEGEGQELDTDDNDEKQEEPSSQKPTNPSEQLSGSSESDERIELKKFENKFRTYYSRILFYSFLTKDKVSSLENIIKSIEGEDNTRIAKNLNLNKTVLRTMMDNMNAFILSQLDYKIQNINQLSNDEEVIPIQRALTAIRKFERLSSSEVATPELIAEGMISLIPEQAFNNLKREKHVLLDMASKAGEYAIAVVRRCERMGLKVDEIKSSVLSIPTSSVAYEFTRKIYEVLGLDIACIADGFNSYDLLKVVNEDEEVDYRKIAILLKQKKQYSDLSLDDEPIGGIEMKFDAVVGNPPYQISDGGAQASARPIYHEFVMMAKHMQPEFLSFITPTRWYAGGKGLDEFRTNMLDDSHIEELHDFTHPEEVFPNTNNRGGVCYYLWNKSYDNREQPPMITTHSGGGEIHSVSRPLRTRGLEMFIRNSNAISIIDKVIPEGCVTDVVEKHVSSRKPFGLDGSFVKDEGFHDTTKGLENPIKCYGKAKKVGYIEQSIIKSHSEWIGEWKVFTPYANNIGTELHDDNQNTFLGEPNSVCTETFLVIGADLKLDRTTAENLAAYLRTKFARFLHGIAKISQHGTAKTYRFVPLVSLDKKWTDRELYTKFGLSDEEIAHIEKSIKPMEQNE